MRTADGEHKICEITRLGVGYRNTTGGSIQVRDDLRKEIYRYCHAEEALPVKKNEPKAAQRVEQGQSKFE